MWPHGQRATGRRRLRPPQTARVPLTHSHRDHSSGLPSLSGTPGWLQPVWLHAKEQRPPHLGFPWSYDVHGDGSVVIVLAGGHTIGSVIVLVTVALR